MFSEEVTLSSPCERLLFDLFSSPEDLFSFSKVHIGRCDVIQRFMIALIIVVVHKLLQSPGQFFRTVIIRMPPTNYILICSSFADRFVP